MTPFLFLRIPLFVLIVCVTACHDTATREERPYTGFTVAPNSTVHRFAVAEIQKFPDWSTNSVLRGRADTQYRKDLHLFFSNGQSLRDVCFRCANVSEYKPGRYAVLLVDDEQEVNTVRLNVEVAGLIPDSFVAKLKEGGVLHLYRHLRKAFGYGGGARLYQNGLQRQGNLRGV